jgi:hypothetical protein
MAETQDPHPNLPPQTTQTSNLAVVSMVAGILTWILIPLLGAIVAIVTGHMARRDIRENQGHLEGNGLATAGLILGNIQIVVVVIPFLCHHHPGPARTFHRGCLLEHRRGHLRAVINLFFHIVVLHPDKRVSEKQQGDWLRALRFPNIGNISSLSLVKSSRLSMIFIVLLNRGTAIRDYIPRNSGRLNQQETKLWYLEDAEQGAGLNRRQNYRKSA